MKQRKDSPPSVGYNFGAAIMFALVIGAVLFLLLPLAQIWEAARNGGDSDNIQVVTPPPPPPPPQQDQQEIEEEQEDVEELKEETPPPTLEQLELALDTDISGELGGGFEMPTFDVASDINEMIFNISDLDEQPTIRSAGQLRYPPALKRAGVEGKVVVQFIVDEAGNVTNPEIYSTTEPGFNESALDFVRRIKFVPGEVDGKPVKFTMRQPLEYSLK